MARMAHFALPMAVRQAASVSTAASAAEETHIRRRRRTSTAASCAESAG